MTTFDTIPETVSTASASVGHAGDLNGGAPPVKKGKRRAKVAALVPPTAALSSACSIATPPTDVNNGRRTGP